MLRQAPVGRLRPCPESLRSYYAGQAAAGLEGLGVSLASPRAGKSYLDPSVLEPPPGTPSPLPGSLAGRLLAATALSFPTPRSPLRPVLLAGGWWAVAAPLGRG